MTNWYLGTMGFGYSDWGGVFYSPGTPARNYLNHYSRYFNSVEMDTTFYGTPRREVIQAWASSTPETFRISAKTPQTITHERGLVGGIDLMLEFLNAITGLGEKLGVVLLQFPPSFTIAQFKILQSFLSELRSFRQAKDFRLAVELRHASWYIEEHDTSVMLSAHNACWTATEFPNLPRDIHLTADFLYFRWIGKHGSYQSHERERVDKTAELKLWWQQLQTYLDRVESIYGYFNNDYAGHAPATCNKFKTIAGFEIKHPEIPKQPRLF